MQKGKCSVLGIFLTTEVLHCHHIKPRALGGTDEFKNLTIVHKHVTNANKINIKYNFCRESNLFEIVS